MIFKNFRPKKVATVKIGANQTQLALPNWSSKLINRELSSMQLLSCNETLAKLLKHNPNKQAIGDSIVAYLAYMRDLLLSIDLPIFLFGGTLLGRN